MISEPIKGLVFTLVAGVVLLGAALMTASSAHAQMGISNDGVTFPDGTVQIEIQNDPVEGVDYSPTVTRLVGHRRDG